MGITLGACALVLARILKISQKPTHTTQNKPELEDTQTDDVFNDENLLEHAKENLRQSYVNAADGMDEDIKQLNLLISELHWYTGQRYLQSPMQLDFYKRAVAVFNIRKSIISGQFNLFKKLAVEKYITNTNEIESELDDLYPSRKLIEERYEKILEEAKSLSL